MNLVPTTYLIIGVSGGGKTECSKRICSRLKRPVIIINGDEQPYREAVGAECVKEGNWKDEKKWTKGKITFVFEDIQALSEAEKTTLKTLLNVKSRHQDCACILITHTIVGSGLMPFLPFFTEIFITSNIGNLRSLKVILKSLSFPEEEAVAKEFRTLPPFTYMNLNTRTNSFSVLDSEIRGMGEKEEELSAGGESVLSRRAQREKIMKYFKNDARFEGIVDFVLDNLPAGYVQWRDLSLKATTTQSGEVKVSLLDYLHALITPDVVTPEPSLIMFHRYLCQTVVFPDILVKNSKMRE